MPILTDIETNMRTMTDAMRITGGYNFDWRSTNEPDLVQNDMMEYENSATSYIEIEPEETNLDEENGVWSQGYSNLVSFRIICKTRLLTGSDNPVFDNNAELNKMLDDYKKLFGTDYSINGTADKIMYSRSVRIKTINGSIEIPSHLEIYFNVYYTQDRIDPTIPDP